MEAYHEAEELLKYLIVSEKVIQGYVSRVAKGEMAVLIYLMEENDGACAIDIAQRFGINTSRVAAILKALCKKGYVERKEDPLDKRKICVSITDEGRQEGDMFKRNVIRHIDELLQRLGQEDSREYLRIMKKVSLILEETSCKGV